VREKLFQKIPYRAPIKAASSLSFAVKDGGKGLVDKEADHGH
jgi:hypothetical protein